MKKDLENPLLLKKVIQDQGVIIVNLNKRFAAINKKLADKVAELAGVYERYYLVNA